LSALGDIVAFSSDSTNLVAGDTNGRSDIFVRDLNTGITTRVSVSTGGSEGIWDSWNPKISADGNLVVFITRSALEPGDTNNKSDVYLHDRSTGVTSRANLAHDGSEPNDDTYGPIISPDGTHVAFFSQASNLVPGDTNGLEDVFVRDITSNHIEIVAPGWWPALSADGRYVAFVAIYNIAVEDNNPFPDIYLYDTQTQGFEFISITHFGGGANNWSDSPAISWNGDRIAFESEAGDLVPGDNNGTSDIFVRRRGAGTTELVSRSVTGGQGNGFSSLPHLSSTGRFVCYTSQSDNLVPNDTNDYADAFVSTDW
jgi:Tol biopolymer transport system component